MKKIYSSRKMHSTGFSMLRFGCLLSSHCSLSLMSDVVSCRVVSCFALFFCVVLDLRKCEWIRLRVECTVHPIGKYSRRTERPRTERASASARLHSTSVRREADKRLLVGGVRVTRVVIRLRASAPRRRRALRSLPL